MDNRTCSVAIPYYNNSYFMLDTLKTPINDDRISEIIICDDKSKDLMQLKSYISKIPTTKIKIFENDKNLGCYHNKINTVKKCTNDWCILLDSDNIIEKDYIDKLFAIEKWDDTTIYSPSRPITFPGQPSVMLDYRGYSNKYITKDIYLHDFNDPKFLCLINNCNYFVPTKNFVECMLPYEKQYNRNYIDCLDSAVLFTDWLTNNNKIFVVNGLTYKHRLHPNSNYARGHSRQHEDSLKKELYAKVKNFSQ